MITWQQLWRVVDGSVELQQAFSFDDNPDWFYFDIGPASLSERVHVDQIAEGRGTFIDVDDARRYAVAWLEARVRVYQIRLAALREQGV